MQYMIQLSNGTEFGPADIALVCQWARERRVPKSALLVPTDGGDAIPVMSVPEVAAVLEPSHPPTIAGATPPPTDSAMSVMIPYKNGAALAAYYLAVFSLIPLVGLLLGFIAFILGIIGLKARNRRPEIHGTAHAWIGIIMGGGLAVIWFFALIFMMIAASNY